MKKSIKIFIQLLRLNFRNFSVSRVNFYISLIATILWTLAYVIFIEVIFGHIDNLSGWDKGQILILMSFFYLFQNFGNIFFRDNFEDFGEALRKGELDFALTRPSSPYLLLFFKKIRFDLLATMIVNVVLFVYAFSQLQSPLSPMFFVLGMVYTGISLAFFFFFLLFLTTFTFWLQKNETINTIIWNLLQVSRYPRQMYQDIAKIIFIFIIPLALLASLPAEIALNFPAGLMISYFVGITIFFGIVSMKFFQYGLKKYTSAS